MVARSNQEPLKDAYRMNVVNCQGVVTGDNPHVEITNNYLAPRPDIAPLRNAYLNWVFETCSYLSLAGIDRKAASESETRLKLSAVYTALLTTSNEQTEQPDKEKIAIDHRSHQVMMIEQVESPSHQVVEQKDRQLYQLSALEQLERHARLVLLGDPGSGKSTFVNFAAMCLAGEALARNDINLQLLITPLPDGQNDPDKPQNQVWTHGALLPVRVILRDFAARGLLTASEIGKARHLIDFIDAELAEAGLKDYREALFDELRSERGGLLLLDGLDEIPNAAQRRKQIQQVVEDFAAVFPHCRILVTSRTYAYQKQGWRLRGFEETILAVFSRGQIEQFVNRWYAHVAGLRGLESENARNRAVRLKQAILNSDRLSELAERPLLLTLIASLHAWRGGTLPEKREELYANTVDLLLEWWESPKAVYDAQGKIAASQPSLAEWLKVDRQKVRSLLDELAFDAHNSQLELQGTADILEDKLVGGLMRISQNSEINPALLVDYLSSRAGLLTPRGVGVYTFPHRTFQEYLAACYLTDHEYPERIADLACQDFNRWREVALLAGAKAARGSVSTLWSFVDALCYTNPNQDTSKSGQAWGARLAGQALMETATLSDVSQRNQSKVDRVRRWLVYILQTGCLPTPEMTSVGLILDTLGDSRFCLDRWYLPNEPLLGFVHIPAGSFQMGSSQASDPDATNDEQPEHSVNLPEYWIARYPVTVAQFGTFMKDSGYKDTHWNRSSGTQNRPVVNVSWFDGLAYCRWVTGRLCDMACNMKLSNNLNASQYAFWAGLAQGRFSVTLPSEAEWEKAARGADARRYPWGKDFVLGKANTSEVGLNDASPVGCFPAGANAVGVMDLSGNVWEWTRSLYKPYPYVAADGRDVLEDNGPRVVRGGSFIGNGKYARCTSRNGSSPNFRYNYNGFRVVVSPQSPAPDAPGTLGR